MTDLLDNVLVKTYFYPVPGGSPPGCSPEHLAAQNVLAAMQEPIKPLEKYLYIERADHIYIANPSDDSEGISGFHPKQLRLPSRFQTPKEEYVMTIRISDSFCTWEYKLRHDGEIPIREVYGAVRDLLNADDVEGVLIHKPSQPEKCVVKHPFHLRCAGCDDSEKAVEAKIRKIRDWFTAMLNLPYNHAGVEAELRELVNLARGGGKR